MPRKPELFMLVLSLAFIFTALGWFCGVIMTRDAAIKAGVAEYRCDPVTGHVEFVFKAETAK